MAIPEDPKLEDIVRRFPENGMKLLLENPANVRDLFAVSASDLARRIDFDRLVLLPTTFVQRDYRHVESDVVLAAPLKAAAEPATGLGVLIYILIEHQSRPDRWMPLRLVEYVAQIYKSQERKLAQARGSLAHARLQPVLPVVFYTGVRPWESPGRLVDLVRFAETFGRFTPSMDVLFVSILKLSPEILESRGGFFGRILRLLQGRKASLPVFRKLLRWAVQGLDAMPPAERLRWLELLSYIHALVYHQRDTGEVPVLQEIIEKSVRGDEHRREVFDMAKSYAQVLQERGRAEGIEKGIEQGREQGEIEARRKTLLRLLRRRFGEVPPGIAGKVEATLDVEALDAWLDGVVTASTLDDVGI